jgi:[acyl-carrier-protein] S-malonyltransferase
MGRDLAEYWPDAMELWVLAEKISGFALREIYWDNDTQAMARTAYLQPALTVVNAGIWGFVKNKLTPACAAGHSLGEYSALFASGVLSINDTLKLVCLRGRLMDEASKDTDGRMAAILKLSREQVESLVDKVKQSLGQEILIANYNTPVQFVISGTQEAVSEVASLAKAAKGRAVILPVSGAFHSPMMAEPAAELAKAMAKVDWKAPVFPVYLNATAQQAEDPRTIQQVMTRQMTSSVYWTQLVLAQWETGVRRFMELGPKGVLSRMTGQILADHKDEIISEHVETLQQAQAL